MAVEKGQEVLLQRQGADETVRGEGEDHFQYVCRTPYLGEAVGKPDGGEDYPLRFYVVVFGPRG